MRRLIAFLLPAICFLSACSIYHVNSEETTSNYYPPKSESVYLEKVEQPNEIIGYVTVNTERIQRMDDVVVKMKREAAILGADAITDIHTDASGVWKKLPAQKFLGNGYVRANFKATAVIFK